jgi:hypothetical protein
MPIINHNVAHYVIGGAALLLASYGAVQPKAPVETVVVQHVVQRPGRADWPALGEGKIEALAEALTGMSPVKVTIYCGQPHCNELKLDLDDAFQLAQWQSQFEERMVESEADKGIFVGPPGQDAENMVAALAKVGLDAKIVFISDENNQPIDGVGIIIGRK